MQDVCMVLLEVLGGGVDGGAGENLYVVRDDRLARTSRRAAGVSAGRVARWKWRVRAGVRVGCRASRGVFEQLGRLLQLCHLGHDAGAVVEARGRCRDGRRRAGRGSGAGAVQRLVGEHGRCRRGRGVSISHGRRRSALRVAWQVCRRRLGQ